MLPARLLRLRSAHRLALWTTRVTRLSVLLYVLLYVLATVPATAQASCPIPEQKHCIWPAIPSTPSCDSTGPAGTAYVRGVNCRTVLVDGYPREYIVYVPRAQRFELDEALPVVFMNHGSSGDGGRFLNISGWTEKAEEVGLIAVYPTALESFSLDSGRCVTKWNSFRLAEQIDPCFRPRLVTPGTQDVIDYPQGAPWPADDVSFMDRTLEDLRSGLVIDEAQLYFSGFSNGAGFAERIAVERADVFAAAAWVGGGVAPIPEGAGPPARNLPIAVLFGNCDENLAENFGYPAPAPNCDSGGAGIPTDADELLANPTFAGVLEALAGVFGLDPNERSTKNQQSSGLIRWQTPAAGNDDGNSLTFAMLDSVTHQYPRCNDRACNNPNRFSAADRFWQFFTGAEASGCPRGDEGSLCLGSNGRFQAEVSWKAPDGSSGQGTAIPFTSDSGLFWFFDPTNVEMLVKVLDACGFNQRYWVFASATTDVEYTLRITDTSTGAEAVYSNPAGTASAAITDTDAFATCP